MQAEEMLEAANMPLLKVNVPPEVRRIAEEEADLTHSPGSSTVVSYARLYLVLHRNLWRSLPLLSEWIWSSAADMHIC